MENITIKEQDATRRHVKICKSSYLANKSNIKSSNPALLHTASADVDPWVFDIQWTVYPQLEGKFKLYLTCNPEFPEHVKKYGKKPDHVLVQIAPKDKGSDESGVWKWSNNISFDVNEEVSSSRLSNGKPSTWDFDSSGEKEYCICVWWGVSFEDEGWLMWDFFESPALLGKPSTPKTSNNSILSPKPTIQLITVLES